MARYEITSQQGENLGTFEASGPLGALDELARDAGYGSYGELCASINGDPCDWTTDVGEFHCGTVGLLVREVEST
jgi:hypothetical protein